MYKPNTHISNWGPLQTKKVPLDCLRSGEQSVL